MQPDYPALKKQNGTASGVGIPRGSDRHWNVINADMLLSPREYEMGGNSFVITVNVGVTARGRGITVALF